PPRLRDHFGHLPPDPPPATGEAAQLLRRARPAAGTAGRFDAPGHRRVRGSARRPRGAAGTRGVSGPGGGRGEGRGGGQRRGAAGSAATTGPGPASSARRSMPLVVFSGFSFRNRTVGSASRAHGVATRNSSAVAVP